MLAHGEHVERPFQRQERGTVDALVGRVVDAGVLYGQRDMARKRARRDYGRRLLEGHVEIPAVGLPRPRQRSQGAVLRRRAAWPPSAPSREYQRYTPRRAPRSASGPPSAAPPCPSP